MFDQSASTARLQQSVVQMFQNRFPFEYDGYTVNVENITFKHPQGTREEQAKTFMDETDLRTIVKGDLIVTKDGKEVIRSKQVLLAAIPFVTERGTYILGGNESVFINQMTMRPGIYVNEKRSLTAGDFIRAEFRAGRQRFTMTFNETQGTLKIEGLGMEFGYAGKDIDAISTLKFLGVPEQSIKDAIGNEDIYKSLTGSGRSAGPEKIYKAFFDSSYPGEEEARRQILDYMTNNLTLDEKGQRVTKAMTGADVKTINPDAFLAAIRQVFKEYKEPGATPNVDDLRFKEVHSGEDVIARAVDSGINEWMKRMKGRIRQNQVKAEKMKPQGYIQKELKTLYSSNLAELIDSGNPLDLHQKRHKLTMQGPGGLGDRSITENNRNLQDTAFGKIDPVETPQSSKLGSTQHIAQDAEIRNGTIYSKYYRVRNGEIDRTQIVSDIDPMDEYDEVVAFHNPAVIEKEDGWRLKGATVKARHKGDFVDVPPNEVTLIDRSPSSHLGHATGMVPFGAHNDGARMLMGASMQRQALALEDPDEPLVQSVSDEETGRTIEEDMAERSSFLLRSPVDGKVSAIKEKAIEITTADGEKVEVEKLNYFSTGKAGGYVNHKPVVKVGDDVKSGSLLADGWQSKNGKMALGKNTLVAYMPYEGYNFEDGVVVSEGFARKMSSEEVKTIEYEIYFKEGIVPRNEAKQRLKDLLVSSAVLSKLDADGVIKKGSKIDTGDILTAVVEYRKKVEPTTAEKILGRANIIETPRDVYIDKSKYVQGYQKGEILDVQKSFSADAMKVSIKLLSFKPMEIGDKLSGRHGNKGTITKILPDAEMPHTEEGRPVELIFSPLAVPSRKNLGQLLEVNAGLVAEKKGMDAYKVKNFDKAEKDKLLRELESIGMPDGKQPLINPKTGKAFESNITVGPMYVMKLHHSVGKSITGRSIGTEDPITNMPKKVSGAIDGDRHNPQGVGGMEFWSLTSAGAVNNIHELTTLKSDGAGMAENKMAKITIYEAIRAGMPLPKPATPQTVKVLKDQLAGTGLSMVPLKDGKELEKMEEFDSLLLRPMRKKDMEALAKAEVTNFKTFDSRTAEPVAGGLYDEKIFGKDGDEWARIDLGKPMANPVFMSSTGARPYEAMLLSKGISQADLIKIVERGHYVVLDPKDSGLNKYAVLSAEELEEEVDINDKEFTYATGSDALNKLLDDVDLKDELRLAEENLRAATKPGERSSAHKHVRTLSAALDNNYEPKDYLLPFVPVMPVKYREPVKANDNRRIAEDGISFLYQNLMKKNRELGITMKKYEGQEDMLDKKALADLEADRYQVVKNIVGMGEPFKDTTKGIEYEGILHRLSSKEGFLRDKMQKKLVDYSGRSVIIGDPELSLDEAGIPEDMAAEIFKPKIESALFDDKYTSEEVRDIMKNRGEPFRRALDKVAENEVVILNRQPSLHRHSLQAFKPIIRWQKEGQTDRAIGINPLVVTGFNADFDGDKMAVHVPITEAAKKEAQEKLMPSQNLLNPTSNSIIMELKHEMQLGLFYMTRDRMPEGMPKEFKDAKELRKAYEKGDVKTYDSVKMNVPMKGPITSTAGRHLFNSVLPPKFQDYEKNVNMKKGNIEKILMEIIEDPKYGSFAAVKVINEWKNIGFKSATNSGMSIGVKDFDNVSSIDKEKLFKEAEKAVSVSNFIDNRDAFENDKMEYVEGRIKDIINSGVLGQDNPVEIMRASGARGNAGQITSMAAVVGRGKDVTSKAIRPVKSSLLEGLTPDEFWDLSNDSRKGIYDRSVASQGPGELTRYVWLSNKQTMIAKKDCGDTKGIKLNLDNDMEAKGLFGRILLQDVELKGGSVIKARPGVPITRKEVDKITKDAKVRQVSVRSPMSCKLPSGICQYCYGAKPGSMTNELAPIGEPVGSIAAQALGEPSQQAIMKTFHTGAGQSNTANSFDRINQVLSLSEGLANEAVIAEAAGTISRIDTDPVSGTTIVIGRKKYKIGKRPKNPNLSVGSEVTAGDALTQEFDSSGNQVTVRKPQDVLRFQGVDAAKEHITHQLELAFKLGDVSHIDRRHMELVVGNMANRAVIDSGGATGLIKDQRAPITGIENFNDRSARITDVSTDYASRMSVIGSKAGVDYYEDMMRKTPIVKKGEVITEEMWEKLRMRRKFVKIYKKNVEFTPELQNVKQDTNFMNNNWLEHAARGHAKNTIATGAGMFMTDKLDNPLTRQMTGLKGNFAEGFVEWAENAKEKFGGLFI